MRRAPSAHLTLSVALALAACTRGATEAPSAADPAAFAAGAIQFPGDSWPAVADPERFGWSAERLSEARSGFEELDSAALLVVHRGVPIASWGAVAARYTVQSVRKALLSGLIGQEEGDGRLRLDATLAELEIDDSPPALTPAERAATVEDLLRSRSGIYHSALYEFGGWKDIKPERGAYPPGERWFYNNWDFNALGTVLERSSGGTIGSTFARRIAEPIGMQDFREGDVVYLTRESWSERFAGNDSLHPAYVFRMSTRDLARFGLLHLAGGRWGERQVIPAEWIARATEGPAIGWLEGDERTRYGYLWWIYGRDAGLGAALGAGLYAARGNRGHLLVVVPELELVIAHEVATGGVGFLSQVGRRLFGSPEVEDEELAKLLRLVVSAHPARRSSAQKDQAGPDREAGAGVEIGVS